MWLSNQTKDTQATHSAALSSIRTDNGHFVVFTDKRCDYILTKQTPSTMLQKQVSLVDSRRAVNQFLLSS